MKKRHKKNVLRSLPAMALLIFSGCLGLNTSTPATSEDNNTLTLYTYESLSADYGLLPLIVPQFEEAQGVDVEIITFADAGTMLNQLIAERENPKADVVMGLDNLQLPAIKEYNLLDGYVAANSEDLVPEAVFTEDDNNLLTPFDYGYVAFVYDSKAITFPEEPISLLDLADEIYKDDIIIEQPGLSSPGTQLVAWVNTALSEEDVATFWNGLANNVLTVTPDWSTAYYNLFIGEQAPIVLSYLTSPAYHIDQEGDYRYKTIPMKEGYLAQVEGSGIVRNANNADAAKAWIDYTITPEVQNYIATTQWVFPALDVDVPDAYSEVPAATPSLQLTDARQVEAWIEQWNQVFSQ